MRKEVNFRFKIWALLLITVSNEGLHLLATSFPLLQSEAVDLRVLWLFVEHLKPGTFPVVWDLLFRFGRK